jgi:hypothetical protein
MARIPVELKNTIQLLYANARTTPTLLLDDAVPIRRGVLQGGVLSSDLFNRYVNDLAELLVNSGYNSFYYTDDLAVITHGELPVRRLVELIERWCRRNFMQLNKTKCGIMFLSGQSTLTARDTTLNEIAGVPLVQSYKYLGIHLTKNLQPGVHLQHLRDKLVKFQKMSFILRAHRAPPHLMLTMWKVF